MIKYDGILYPQTFLAIMTGKYFCVTADNQLAYEVGVGQRYLSKIEHGLARPEFEKVFKIAQVLGLSLDYLAGTEYKDNNPDYLTNTINIRLQLLSREEKVILLEAVE